MNVLSDPIFVIDEHAAQAAPIPLHFLLARLITGPEVHDFPNLSADQRSYWWRFLVRCAARALRTANMTVSTAQSILLEELAADVRQALLRHSSDDDWSLVPANGSAPAFLQSPTPNGGNPEDAGYRPEKCALLTAVIGTREHERKSEVQRHLAAEALVYALIEYQSGVIFGGRGNYESQLTGSRSGAGSGTPFMGVLIGDSMVRSFRHDVSVMLDRWDETARDLRGDVWALWREPWDGATPLPATRLDPAFVPYARMVRVEEPVADVFDRVWFLPSKGSRVADHTKGGALGDPFTPLVVDPKRGHLKVRGALEKGYDYAEVVRLIFPRGEDAAHPSPSVAALLDRPAGDDDVWIVFEGLAFEQGKTRGFHRRTVWLPPPPPRLTFGQYYRDPIQQAHQVMLEATSRTRRALRSAFTIVMRNDPRTRDDDRKKTHHVLARFEDLVDAEYLDYLFAVPEKGTDATLDYRNMLFEWAVGDVFPLGVGALPRNSSRAFELEIRAEAYLRARLRRDLELPSDHQAREAA